MLFKSSAIEPVFFKSKPQNAAPVTLKKRATTSCGVKFYNSNRGILVIDTLNAVNFKVDDNTYLTIQKVQSK